MVEILVTWVCFSLIAGILIAVIGLISKATNLQTANDRLRHDIDYLVISNQLTAEEFLSHNEAIETFLNLNNIKKHDD